MTAKASPLQPMFPAADLARSLGLSPQTIRNWIHSGQLEAVNVARPHAARPRYLIKHDDLNRFLASRRVSTAASGKA